MSADADQLHLLHICVECERPYLRKSHLGRPSSYCCAACRQRVYRRRHLARLKRKGD